MQVELYDEQGSRTPQQPESESVIAAARRELEIQEATFRLSRKKAPHFSVSEHRRCRSLQENNAPVKRVVAALT